MTFSLTPAQREMIHASIEMLQSLLLEDNPTAPPAPELVPITCFTTFGCGPTDDERRGFVSLDVDGNGADYGRLVVVVE